MTSLTTELWVILGEPLSLWLNKNQRLLLLSNSSLFVSTVALPLITAGQHTLWYKGENPRENNAAKASLECPSLCLPLISCGRQSPVLNQQQHTYILNYFPPPLVIHKVPAITVNRCGNTALRTLIPSDAMKPMASGTSHDTRVPQ